MLLVQRLETFSHIQVTILASAYGFSFWIIPSVGVIASSIATLQGDPSAEVWFTSLYTVCDAIAFMICGANSDLFGRRWFLIMGNILLFVGHIMAGAAKNATTMIVAFAIIGFGAGNAQLAAFALPELLPNKWRHIAITIADLGTWVAVVIGPIAARYAIRHGNAWRWLFYAPAIGTGFSVIALYFLYFPPAHPRGLTLRRAIRELDYGGAILFILSSTLILVGIVYTIIIPARSPKVNSRRRPCPSAYLVRSLAFCALALQH